MITLPVPKFSSVSKYVSVILIVLILSSKAEEEVKSNSVQKSPIVTIPGQGDVQGLIKQSRNGRDYFAYLGIPYAETPKRFKNPKPISKGWNGLRNATVFGSDCVQMCYVTGKSSGSEDCLNLNIFSSDLKPEKLLPTIIFIHGGGFTGGSGGQYGVEYFMGEKVVFITFNYRLGPFGFLNTGDGLVDGNVGLKDQTHAMTWVKKNIKLFGGDDENITIFGGSAGAACVSFHIISPMSKGLFQRAISGSGTAQCAWAFDSNPQKNAKELAAHLNCPTTDSNEMIKCLLEKPAEDLVGKNFSKSVWAQDLLTPFIPSKEYKINPYDSNDQIFLPDDPTILLNEGKFNKIPWLTGVTRNEGLALHSAAIIHNPVELKLLNENWNEIAPITFSFQNLISKEKWTEVSTKIREFYFGDKSISNETADNLEKVYSDRNFFQGVRNTILAHAKHNSPVYPYFFDFKEKRSWLVDVYGFNTSGVTHGDDFAYYFKFYMDPRNPESAMGLEPNSKAEEMSKKLVKLIVSFAENGEPDGTWGDVKWPKSTVEEGIGLEPLSWYHLDQAPTLQKETPEFSKRMNFWNNLFNFSSSGSSYRSEL